MCVSCLEHNKSFRVVAVPRNVAIAAAQLDRHARGQRRCLDKQRLATIDTRRCKDAKLIIQEGMRLHAPAGT